MRPFSFWVRVTCQSFELHRLCDGHVYEFDLGSTGCYRRKDAPELIILWDDDLGWVARLPGSGELAGRVWDLPVAAQGAAPPEGRWVSSKGAKSYVYTLKHVTRSA